MKYIFQQVFSRSLWIFVPFALFTFALPSHGFSADLRWTLAERESIKTNAKIITQEKDRFKFETENYIILTEIDPEFTIKTGLFMEKVRKNLISVFGIKLKEKITLKPSVFILKDRDSFSKETGVENDGAGGKYIHRFNKDGTCHKSVLLSYIHYPKEIVFEDFYHPVLIHEGAHQILQHFAGKNRLPKLLNEGVAEYIDGWDFFQTPEYNMRHRTSTTLPSLRRLNYKLEFLPLADIFTAEPWDIDRFGIQTLNRYFHAEMFIETLLTDPKGKDFLKVIFEKSCDGALDMDETKKKLIALQPAFETYVKANFNKR